MATLVLLNQDDRLLFLLLGVNVADKDADEQSGLLT